MIKKYVYIFVFALLCYHIINICEESPNNTTLQSYESNINAYINGTPSVVSGITKLWIDKTLSMLSPHARVVEIGSAFGRDAHYMKSCGFTVECTDATKGFVTFLQQNGFSARLFNILTDEFTQSYDLVFANAVFLHFTHSELIVVLNKIHNTLSTGGVLSFSVKRGNGDEWSVAKLENPRYFCYWQPEALKDFVIAANFEVIDFFENECFLHIIAIKS